MEHFSNVLMGLIVTLCTILTFFITNSLKKIDNIIRIEEKLELSLKKLEEITDEVKKNFSHTLTLDQEVIRLKEKVQALVKKIETIENKMGF